MTDKQRWAAAADMLTSARAKDGQTSSMPPDDLITSFMNQVATGCDGAPTNVAETGASIYLIGRSTFGPS